MADIRRLLDEIAAPEWDLAPAAEVRGRADARRRRRRVGGSIAGLGVAMAAAVPVTFAALAGGGGASTVASEERVTTVPDGFPLATGMASAPRLTGGSGAVDDVVLCGDDGWARRIRERTTDVLMATEGSVDPGEQRLLLVFPDDGAAEQALRVVRRAAGGCAARPGADTVLSVRVGNALLLSRVRAGGAGAVTENDLAAKSASVVLRMCVFAEHPCP